MRTLTILLVSMTNCSSPEPRMSAEGEYTNPPNCLAYVWHSGQPTDKSFDVANDGAGNDAISCSTLTTPTAFERFLGRVKAAAMEGDERALADLVDYPLTFIDQSGERHLLTREQLSQPRQTVFRKDVLETLSQVALSNMQVVNNKGGFFAGGAIWLTVRSEGGEPKIGTVNHKGLLQFRQLRDQQSRGKPLQ